MDRRAFLKTAGVSSAALTLPVLGPAASALALSGQTNVHYVTLSSAGVVGGVHHIVAMTGEGFVTQRQVVAHGTFFHFNNDPALPVPKPILATGTWNARRLVSFETIGSYGVALAGTLEADIDLIPEGDGRLSARLTVNCNLGPAGLFTGLPEGIFLEVDSLHFEPFVPPLGLTVFTEAVQTRGA